MVNGDSGTSHTGAMHSYYKCKGRKHKHCDLPTFRKELQIQHRKFSRAEIEASLEILTDKPFKTDMEKKALFTKFITRIDLYKDGRMNIYTDIFGIKGEIQAIDKSKSEVQLEKRLARH